MKYSPSTICLPLRNDIFICHRIKSPPFKERKLLHFTCTPLSYNQYSGKIFCSPAKYSFLPESCHKTLPFVPLCLMWWNDSPTTAVSGMYLEESSPIDLPSQHERQSVVSCGSSTRIATAMMAMSPSDKVLHQMWAARAAIALTIGAILLVVLVGILSSKRARQIDFHSTFCFSVFPASSSVRVAV